MSATYFLLLTDHGSTRLAAAQAGTQPFQITHLAIGDANNLPYLPQSRVSEMTLVNEQARVPVQSVAVVGGQVEVVATVDSTVGGFNVHEIGLLDEAGQLLYIGNYHGGYKPILTEGAGGDLELVCVLKTSNLTPVVVEMNPTVVTANRQWVLDHFVRIPAFATHVEQFNTHVAQYNSHVTQNNLEHANLLALIQAVNQRVSNLEIREEVQIGEFIITDDPRNPVLYKGYGEWRLVPNVMLSGLDLGGVTGQVRQIAVGTGQNVRTTFFWRRIDPNAIQPTRTVTIAADAFEINLRDLFVAQYGEPVIGEQVKFVIAAGVLVTAYNTSNYAIVTGDWPPQAALSMDVYGIAAGRGGNGATGSTTEFSATNERPCIFASHPLLVNNFNIVAGGGGGGGWEAPADNNNYKYGGGGGAPFGLAGYSSYNDYSGFNPLQYSQSGGREFGGLTAEYDLATDIWTYTSRVAGGGLGQAGVDGTPRDLPTGTEWASFDGGLAGIAITGLVTVIGNPVLGR